MCRFEIHTATSPSLQFLVNIRVYGRVCLPMQNKSCLCIHTLTHNRRDAMHGETFICHEWRNVHGENVYAAVVVAAYVSTCT